MCMQETKTLHPQPPLYRELVPQFLSPTVLLIAIKWIQYLIVGIMGQDSYYGTGKVDEQVNN